MVILKIGDEEKETSSEEATKLITFLNKNGRIAGKINEDGSRRVEEQLSATGAETVLVEIGNMLFRINLALLSAYLSVKAQEYRTKTP